MKMRNKPLVLFAGGGSGGHLFPGIALAEEFTGNCGWDAVFLSTKRPVENSVFGDYAFHVRTCDAPTMPRKVHKLPGFALKLLGSIARAEREIGMLKPTAVVGLGGYGSFAPVAAAARRGIPTFLLEQNAVPGKANRLLSTWVKAVYTQFECSRKHFRRPARVEVTGNPLRKRIAPESRFMARYRLGMNIFKRTILVMGGSQGASALNRIFAQSVDIFKKYPPSLQILHLCGDKDKERLSAKYEEGGIRAVVLPFLSEMELAYSAADLVVARAGGTTIAELAHLGKPAVLVPLPHAAEDHQRKNAHEFALTSAATIVEEKELTPEVIAREVLDLLYDDALMAERRKKAAAGASPNATRHIAARIIAKVTGRPIMYRRGILQEERSA